MLRAGARWRRLTPLNELGAKGIGESGTIGSTPAVHNAVIDALAHLGRAPPRHAGHPREGVASHRCRPERSEVTPGSDGVRTGGCVGGVGPTGFAR